MSKTKEKKYVIARADRPGRYLRGLGIGCCNTLYPDRWTSYIPNAIQFNEDEGTTTIQFITNVLDEYLGKQLYLEEIKE